MNKLFLSLLFFELNNSLYLTENIPKNYLKLFGFSLLLLSIKNNNNNAIR